MAKERLEKIQRTKSVGKSPEVAESPKPRITAFVGPRGKDTFGEHGKLFSNEAQTEYVDQRGREPAISAVNELDKVSRDYYDCTGLAAIGLNRDGKKISFFLTHQRTGNPEDFRDQLIARLQQFKRSVQPGKFDIVIFGGKYHKNPKSEGPFAKKFERRNESYEESVAALKELAVDTLGVEPRIVEDTTAEGTYFNVKLETAGERLYIIYRD